MRFCGAVSPARISSRSAARPKATSFATASWLRMRFPPRGFLPALQQPRHCSPSAVPGFAAGSRRSISRYSVDSRVHNGFGREATALPLLVPREPESQKLPSIVGIKETAVGRTHVLGPGRARPAADDHLIAHE